MLDLATLVAPLTVDEFMASHWPERPWWSPDGPGRLAALADAAVLDSSEATLAGAGRVMVFKPDGSPGWVPTGEAALPLFRLGLTCSFGGMHVPSLRAAAAGVAEGLGLPDSSMACEVFCSSGRSGARMHSDHDLNFAVLLRGTKRWRIAPNRNIRNQTNMCVPDGVPPPDPSQLLIADDLPFPDAMPPDATEIEIGPGGVLFLPRGWWHETVSDGDCLQVNFVVTGPTWITVLLRALEQRLLVDPRWRAYAFDAWRPDRRDRGRKELAGLLAALVAGLAAAEPLQRAAEVIAESGLDRFS